MINGLLPDVVLLNVPDDPHKYNIIKNVYFVNIWDVEHLKDQIESECEKLHSRKSTYKICSKDAMLHKIMWQPCWTAYVDSFNTTFKPNIENVAFNFQIDNKFIFSFIFITKPSLPYFVLCHTLISLYSDNLVYERASYNCLLYRLFLK